jgi:hypothetical protein
MSDKSIAQRMFLKKDQRFLLIGDPPGYVEAMGSLPEGLILLREPQPPIHVIQVFVKNMTELQAVLAELLPYLTPKIPIWVSYPKGTAGVKTDINRDIIWEYVKSLSMSATSIFSIDSTWSAMRVILTG